jgi:hypothetical protein
MITPGTYDTTAYQDATWRKFFRLTEKAQQIAVVEISTGTPTFKRNCHDLQAGDKVVFTADGESAGLCGLELNRVYYVIAAGLTADEFQVSATNGGSSISVTGQLAGVLTVSQPVGLTGYTADSDIVTFDSLTQVATFQVVITEPGDGGIEMVLAPAVTRKLLARDYRYDASLVSSSGEKYYWLTGRLSIQSTYSRM